ncbi:MAG TPA: TonB-dependent receptor, partial [Steroidobacteraceae bacterium]
TMAADSGAADVSTDQAVGVFRLAQADTAGQEAASSAAETAPAAGSSSSELQEVVVTGSRVGRQIPSTPNPVTVIGEEQIAALGQINAADTIKLIPQNSAFQSTANIGFAAAQQQGNVGVETANLRGLNPSNGGVRTLVLVDTRRFVPTTAGGAVDLNQIPSMLIKSVEVVTGGASAQYGTDALAGVVNIILDKHLTGFKGQVDFGQTFEGDGETIHGAFAGGLPFADGRGHIIFGTEYSKDKGIGDCTKVRDWCAEAWFTNLNDFNNGSRLPEGHPALRGNPPIPPNGLPRNLILPDSKFSQATLQGTFRGGVVGIAGIDLDTGLLAAPVNTGNGTATAFNLPRSNPGPLEFMYFTDDGMALRPYDPGLFPTPFGNAVGGDGGPKVRRGSESPINIPSERLNFLSRAEFELKSDLNFFFETNFASRENHYMTSSQGPQSFFVLNSNNAYLQCANYDQLTNEQRATPEARQANCQPVMVEAPAGTVIQSTNRIGVYAPGELDAENRLTVARMVPVTDLPSRRWNALRTDINAGERYLAPGATAPYTSQDDFVNPTIGQFAWAKHVEDAARPLNDSMAKTWRFVTGLEGKVFDRFSWDAYYQFGHSKQEENLNNTRTDIFFKAAIDAVFAPDGSIQCNILVDPNHPNNPNNPNNVNDPALNAEYQKCKPLNLLGLTEQNGRLDPEALAYAYRTQENDVEYKQHVLAGNIRGDIWEGWAGPIGAAAGFESRLEKGWVTHGDEMPPWYRYYSRPQLGYPYSGELKIMEAYAEVNVPVLQEVPLAQRLEIGAAYRRTWQENKDTTPGFEASKKINFPTWKGSINWDVTDWLRLRGTRSRDVRAAGFRDLTFKGTPAQYGAVEGRLINPWPECNGGQVQNCNEDNSVVTLSGAFNLLPEEGDTTTLGFVFTPSGWARGFQLSFDWYEIDIARAISSAGTGISAQGIVDQCFNFGNFCEFIQQDVGGNNSGPFVTVQPGQPVTDIGTVRPVSQNLGGFTQRGMDIEVGYFTDLSRFSERLRGTLNIRSVFTHVYDFIVDPNAAVAGDEIDYAGQSAAIGGGAPSAFADFQPSSKWRHSHWITYGLGGFSTTLGIRHIGHGIYNILWHGPGDPLYDPTRDDSINDNTVDESTIFSLAMSYKFNPFRNDVSSTEVFLAMDNIFDKEPPIAPSGVGYQSNPTYFDQFGARYRAGIRMRF